MSTVAIVTWAATSGLGDDEDALAIAAEGERAVRAVRRDDALASAGLVRPFASRAAVEDGPKDRATRLLERTLGRTAERLDAAMPGWRHRRVGLALGTSSGGMSTFETRGHEASLVGTYFGPTFEAERPVAFAPATLVLGACASGALAIGVARAWLLAGACDIAFAGGYDAVSTFVASGFEALRATCTEAGPRPFRVDRTGLALGEGAAMLALARSSDVDRTRAYAFVSGFGASCDAVHLTAPDRTGAGLVRAAKAALADASLDAARIGLVGAHGTATEYNDAAEAKAIAAVLGARSVEVPVHAPKGAIGHTLGAAGALETLALASAMQRTVAPASWGDGPLVEGVRVGDRTTRHEATHALKLSSAFGGANAALVVGAKCNAAPAPAPEPPQRATEPVYVSRAVAIAADDALANDPAALSRATGVAEDKIARADGLVRHALAACAALAEREGELRGAGIVVGHGLATIETNALYLERIRTAGAHRGEPRRFPYTTPNAAAGECAVAFGLDGPAFAVGGGPHGGIEAIMVARDLVRGGHASRIVVVAVDEAADASRRKGADTVSGAVALVVSAAPTPGAGRIEEATVGLAAGADPSASPASLSAHVPLVSLANGVADRGRVEVTAAVPRGGFAKLAIFWL